MSAPPHPPTDGLIHACVLDGRGGARAVDWAEVDTGAPGDGVLWVHLDYAGERARGWLEERSGLDAIAVAALTAPETRPRSFVLGPTLCVILRGVNAVPGADPEDMVSIRIALDARRVVTLRHRRLLAAQEVRAELASCHGPRDAASLLVALVEKLQERIAPVVADLDDAVDGLEDEILTAESQALRSKIARLRRDAVGLRRYLAPQRDAMARLPSESVPWLGDADRMRLRELADRTTRSVEDLDAARERAAVTREELDTRLSERMNRTMYVLSIVTAVFLPLGLVTGVLGVNVGGVPLTEEPNGFTFLCLLLVGIAALIVLVFRRMRWI